MIDPARLCIALGPLAGYLLVLGLVNSSRRPFVTTGTRELLALGVGLSGLAVVGPIELLTSTSVVVALGPTYWALVLGLYGAGWILVTMYVRQRLVVYNVGEAELAAALGSLARELDPEAQWAGQTLLFPGWQAQVALEAFTTLWNVSIVGVGEGPPPALWQQLEIALRGRLGGVRVGRGAYGLGMVLLAVAMFVALACLWVYDARTITRGLVDMLGVG